MELAEFWKKIELPEEAVRKVQEVPVSEAEYLQGKELFYQEKEQFYEWIKKQPDYRLRFLYFYSRLGCEVYRAYQERQIPEQIYWDTFRDLTYWCENCYREYGEYGINQYDWFFRHIEMTIFRLGRLEFERLPSEWEFVSGESRIQKGDPIIFIHIPQGEELDIQACKASVEQAYQFWGRDYIYICHSWLLYPELKKLLKPDSNILEFQKLFDVIDVDFKEREAEWRIFIKVQDVPEKYPEQTSLQRAAKAYLQQGGQLGNGFGVWKSIKTI